MWDLKGKGELADRERGRLRCVRANVKQDLRRERRAEGCGKSDAAPLAQEKCRHPPLVELEES